MLSPATRVALSTVRLECTGNGRSASLGTGFLYNFRETPDSLDLVPVIVTNKHVVGTSTRLSTVITTVDTSEPLTEAALGQNQTNHTIVIDDLQRFVVPHPDTNTDLCVILFGPFVRHFLERPGFRHLMLDESWLPGPDLREFLRVVEPILMVGYPNGIWDTAHNLPVVRDGKTASHPLLRWSGTSSFVVDTAVFGGSSGSPIFFYEDGLYRSSANNYQAGSRVALLGILWAGPTLTLRGELEPAPVPTAVGDVPVMRSMMNLGFAVKADALLDLKAPVLARAAQ
jgi:Trypsin-like peptidase domain